MSETTTVDPTLIAWEDMPQGYIWFRSPGEELWTAATKAGPITFMAWWGEALSPDGYEFARAEQQPGEMASSYKHELSLIEADTQRGVTDCSTPVFQRVRNIVEYLAQAEAALTTLRAEVAEALKVLDPNVPESGLVDACKQVKQVAISEADNSEVAEAQLAALRSVVDAVEKEIGAVADLVARIKVTRTSDHEAQERNLRRWVEMLRALRPGGQ